MCLRMLLKQGGGKPQLHIFLFNKNNSQKKQHLFISSTHLCHPSLAQEYLIGELNSHAE